MNKLVEIKKLESYGYENIFCYDNWKVSMLSYLPELELTNINYLEKHLETDEIFYLLAGECTLIIGDYHNDKIIDLELITLKKEQIYNVKKGTFHNHVLSPDGKVLIVENKDTDNTNSQRYQLSMREKEKLKKRWKEKNEKMLWNKLLKKTIL